jgi:antitoxin component YwqK of YwqJK toxin-antitoxin module
MKVFYADGFVSSTTKKRKGKYLIESYFPHSADNRGPLSTKFFRRNIDSSPENTDRTLMDGYFVSLYTSGVIDNEGIINNGKREGKWIDFYSIGMLFAITVFGEGLEICRQSFCRNGLIKNNMSYNFEGSIITESFHENGMPTKYNEKIWNKKINREKRKVFHDEEFYDRFAAVNYETVI